MHERPELDAVPTRVVRAFARLDQLRRTPRRLVAVVVASVVGVVVVASALVPGVSPSPPGAAAPAHGTGASRRGGGPTASTRESSSDLGSAGSTVVVQVAGAVARPGVVTLPASDRVVDAIAAVGGARPDGDPQQLDLAARLVDGSRIYVPRRGETLGAAPGGASTGGSSSPGPAAPVRLNSATATELEALPGFGPSLAAAIVAERERRGGFRSVDDLRSVHGIGDRRLEQLRPLVAL